MTTLASKPWVVSNKTHPTSSFSCSLICKQFFPAASWTSAAESNIYKRGQLVNLQVLAKTRKNQEVFIQSCFVSVFPEPRAKPRQTVIFNKGWVFSWVFISTVFMSNLLIACDITAYCRCVTPLGSSTTIVTFVASDRADAVNFVLNTSYLISEVSLYKRISLMCSSESSLNWVVYSSLQVVYPL